MSLALKHVFVPVFDYADLSETAKQKAIQEVKTEHNNDQDAADTLLENWRDQLSQIGFTNAEIYYSRMYCQGQGASFTADVDVVTVFENMIMATSDYETARRYLAAIKLYEIGQIDCRIIDLSSPYDHELTKTVDPEIFFLDKTDQIRSAFADMENYRIDLCKKIMDDLLEEDEILQSDNYIESNIIGGKYYFFENGNCANQYV